MNLIELALKDALKKRYRQIGPTSSPTTMTVFFVGQGNALAFVYEIPDDQIFAYLVESPRTMDDKWFLHGDDWLDFSTPLETKAIEKLKTNIGALRTQFEATVLAKGERRELAFYRDLIPKLFEL